LANRDAYAKQHQQGQVYKTHYPKGENPFHKAGMKDKRSTKMSAYDISNTGPKGVLPESGVAEGEKKGLYYNVNKRKAAGTSRPASNPKAPTDQAWKDAAKTAKTEGVSETTSSAGMATAPGVGKGPATGTLFGGSYAPRTPFTGKKKAKTSVIKR
jgi:hypothetical protein